MEEQECTLISQGQDRIRCSKTLITFVDFHRSDWESLEAHVNLAEPCWIAIYVPNDILKFGLYIYMI